MTFLEVIAWALKIRQRSRRPADTHLAAQHLFKTRVHFILFDQFATICLRDSFAHGVAELNFFREAQGGVLHKLGRIRSSFRGNLRKLLFLLGSELDVHIIQDTVPIPPQRGLRSMHAELAKRKQLKRAFVDERMELAAEQLAQRFFQHASFSRSFPSIPPQRRQWIHLHRPPCRLKRRDGGDHEHEQRNSREHERIGDIHLV
jgi:hypothetical protein